MIIVDDNFYSWEINDEIRFMTTVNFDSLNMLINKQIITKTV